MPLPHSPDTKSDTWGRVIATPQSGEGERTKATNMNQPRVNDKDRRIMALADKFPHRSVDWIAQKIGYGSPPTKAGIERVQQALAKR